jgi:hypothetical protein
MELTSTDPLHSLYNDNDAIDHSLLPEVMMMSLLRQRDEFDDKERLNYQIVRIDDRRLEEDRNSMS